MVMASTWYRRAKMAETVIRIEAEKEIRLPKSTRKTNMITAIKFNIQDVQY